MRIYVDAFNFGTRWFKINHGSHFNSLKVLKKNVKRFSESFKNSGHELVICLDGTRASKEAVRKHQKRIEQGIRRGEATKVPECFGQLIADAFVAAGVKDVRFSQSVDNDDLMAYLAQKDGAAILSRDQDFFRYKGRSYDIYSDWDKTKAGKVSLQRAVMNEKKFAKENTTVGETVDDSDKESINDSDSDKKARKSRIKLRDFIDHDQAKWRPQLGLFIDLEIGNYFRCGAVTPLIKTHVNPMLTTRPLRQALYARLGKDRVLEIIPSWDADQGVVAWSDDYVPADDKYKHWLEADPAETLAHFFPSLPSSLSSDLPDDISDQDLANHIYGIYVSVYSVYARVSGIPLLKLLESVAPKFGESLAYSFNCSLCSKKSGLTKADVEFYKKKGFSMPRKCQECRDLRKRFAKMDLAVPKKDT